MNLGYHSNIASNENGNISSYKDKEFFYDFLNRLIEVKQNSQTIVTYSYDAFNRRVSKTLTAQNKIISYVYHKNQVIKEYENETLTNSYVYASYIDDPIAYTYKGNTYYYIKDRQYSIRAISNENGDILESYSYNSFGIITMKDENNNVILESKINNTITFTGRRYDKESGLYYYRNRMYSAQLGRFISKDPKGYIDGMNLYAYVKNNPLKYLDAFGTTAQKNGIINNVAGWYSNLAENFATTGTQTHQNRLTTQFFGIGGKVVGKMKYGYDLINSTTWREAGIVGVGSATATASGMIVLSGGTATPFAPYAGALVGLFIGGEASDYAGKMFDKYFILEDKNE